MPRWNYFLIIQISCTSASEVESQLENESAIDKVNGEIPVSNGHDINKLSFRLQTWKKLESMDQVIIFFWQKGWSLYNGLVM